MGISEGWQISLQPLGRPRSMPGSLELPQGFDAGRWASADSISLPRVRRYKDQVCLGQAKHHSLPQTHSHTCAHISIRTHARACMLAHTCTHTRTICPPFSERMCRSVIEADVPASGRCRNDMDSLPAFEERMMDDLPHALFQASIVGWQWPGQDDLPAPCIVPSIDCPPSPAAQLTPPTPPTSAQRQARAVAEVQGCCLLCWGPQGCPQGCAPPLCG